MKLEPELDALSIGYPLPPGWTKTELYAEEQVIGNLSVKLVGIAASNNRLGQTATGSAASLSSFHLDRAYFELLERVSTLEAAARPGAYFPLLSEGFERISSISCESLFPKDPSPRLWRHSKSNGVACHLEIGEAARRAALELIERDRVLRAWYGERDQVSIQRTGSGAINPDLRAHFGLKAYLFTQDDPNGVQVACLFGHAVHRRRIPFYGFGAGRDAAEAVLHAQSDGLQRIGFLWGEKPPAEPPPFSPTPDYHQETYLMAENIRKVRDWLLDSEPMGARRPGRPIGSGRSSSVEYADITPEHLKSKLYVIKALSGSRLPLIFGNGYDQLYPGVPASRRVHPVA